MAIDTIIFDLDGTLINSLKDLQNSINYAIYPYKYPKQTIDMVRGNIGNGIEKLIERSIPQGKDNSNYENCVLAFKKHYSENMMVNTQPYPQIVEMLATLKTQGYKTAVVSNKFDVAVKPLCKLFFNNLIDLSLGQSPEIRKKPSPDGVYVVFDELNTNNNSTIFVGDSDVDIQTAKNAQIDCISVSWGYKTKEFLKNNGAQIIIDSPLEIFHYLK